MSRRRFLVAWDVSHPKRLKKVRRIAEDFGNPLQKSVFLCELKVQERDALEGRLGKVLNRKEDQVVFLDLGLDTRDPAEFLHCMGIPATLSERVVVV